MTLSRAAMGDALLAVCVGVAVALGSGCATGASSHAPTRGLARATDPRATTLAGELLTESFIPEPVRLTVDDLPAPYATESARHPPELVDPPAGAVLHVPPGFRVQLFAEGLPDARWLVETPDGDVLCALTRRDTIVRLRDRDGDGVADEAADFASRRNGLDLPFGMAFADGALFIGFQNQVRRFSWTPGQASLEGLGERVTMLPGGGYNQHWTRNVVAAPDGERLFVTVGSRTNVEPEASPRASVFSMRFDGTDRRTFASGLRNPVGLAFHPRTGVPFVTVNERDELGDGLVPDYLTHLEPGAFYGWPYAYLSPELLDPRRVVDGRSERPDLVARTVTPDVLFEPHSAPLGIAFYQGDGFPERYRRGAFVAFRGSWNRSRGTGYSVVFVPFGSDSLPTGEYEPFVFGFLLDPSVPTTWGRPVGLLARRDGSLLFTDEPGGRVYRVSYGRGI